MPYEIGSSGCLMQRITMSGTNLYQDGTAVRRGTTPTFTVIFPTSTGVSLTAMVIGYPTGNTNDDWATLFRFCPSGRCLWALAPYNMVTFEMVTVLGDTMTLALPIPMRLPLSTLGIQALHVDFDSGCMHMSKAYHRVIA